MKKLLIVLCCSWLAACQSDMPVIQGFEAYVWKRDKYGCSGERTPMADTLLAQRDRLLKLTEQEVVGVLGQPDARELYVRNQKFLIYLLEPNNRCTAGENATVEAKALYIRLNALGRANEMYINEF